MKTLNTLFHLSYLSVACLFLLTYFSSCTPDKSIENRAVYQLQGDGYGLTSTIFFVQDIDSTRKYFSEVLGFGVSPEPKKGNWPGTEVVQARFSDYSLMKFIAINDSTSRSDIPAFITSYLDKKEGLGLYSIASSSVDTTLEWLHSQGFEMDSIKALRLTEKAPEGWSSDDGGADVYILGFDKMSLPSYRPLFEQPVGSFFKEIKNNAMTALAYGRSFNPNANGVIGTKALQIVVEHLDSVRTEFRKMGLLELENNGLEHIAKFQLRDDQEIHFISPQTSEDEYAQFLADRGEGILKVVLEVKNLDSTYAFLEEKLPEEALLLDSVRLKIPMKYAKGTQLEFQEESEEKALLAQQYKLGPKLDDLTRANMKGIYLKYCALCHGEDREGYAADNAPSLRSKSLLATTKDNNFLRYTIQYGREGTAMGGYFNTQGGPLEYIEVELLLQWLYEESGVEEPIELSREPVKGNLALGETIYQENCSTCHGKNGEGVTAPALGNPMLLATASDHFLRYAISEGRDSTPMIAFKDSLSDIEIDAVTAFLRSRASGWDIPQTDTISLPLPEDYVLNPDKGVPDFKLREGRYVSAKQLNQALQDSSRIVLLDARSTVAWRQSHIPGAVPVPYYEEPEAFVKHIPNNDSTWVVAYCACPHAASGTVINTLNRYGYKNTAILDEGILVWAQMGFPVRNGN